MNSTPSGPEGEPGQLINPRQFTRVADVYDLPGLLAQAGRLRQDPQSQRQLGQGKALGLLFFNPSLRTRLSSQRAAQLLGMDCMVMNVDQDGWKLETQEGIVMNGDKAEHIKDAVGVLSTYCDILGVRSFARLQDRAADQAEEVLHQFLKHASIPVMSLESTQRHPLQSLADLLTIKQAVQVSQPKIVLTWAPHPRALPHAVGNSFAEWMLAAGHDLHIAQPTGYELDPIYTKGATLHHNQQDALRDADVVYVKSWAASAPYGQAPTPGLQEWTVSSDTMQWAKPEAKIMHCLPVRRNVVISDALLDGPQSLIMQQAANRVLAAQTILQQWL